MQSSKKTLVIWFIFVRETIGQNGINDRRKFDSIQIRYKKMTLPKNLPEVRKNQALYNPKVL